MRPLRLRASAAPRADDEPAQQVAARDAVVGLRYRADLLCMDEGLLADQRLFGRRAATAPAERSPGPISRWSMP